MLPSIKAPRAAVSAHATRRHRRQAADDVDGDEEEPGIEAPADVPASTMLQDWVLPHLPTNESKLDSLAHAVSLLAFDTPDDIDHGIFKRLHTPADMLASSVGAIWHASFRGLVTHMTKHAVAVTKGQGALTIPIAVAAIVDSIGRATVVFAEDASNGARHIFRAQKIVGPDGTDVVGACLEIKRFNVSSRLALTRRTRHTASQDGSRATDARQVHGSATGLIAPEVAKDDANIGQVITV